MKGEGKSKSHIDFETNDEERSISSILGVRFDRSRLVIDVTQDFKSSDTILWWRKPLRRVATVSVDLTSSVMTSMIVG
jgi:hypothetical protein